MKSTRPLAVVTGGAGLGIGSGVTKTLVQRGWDVIVVDRDEKSCETLLRELDTPEHLHILTIDLTDAWAPEKVSEVVVKLNRQISGLVNNAGVGFVRSMETISDDEFDRLFAVNVRAAFRLTRNLIHHFCTAAGSIVNLASVHGRHPLPGFSAYAATKGAIEAMSRGWAVDLGRRGIRVNCVAPGMVDCPQTRQTTAAYVDDVDAYLARWAETRQLLPNLVTNSDVGELVAFLLGPKSQGLTGQTILIDAGTTLLLTDRE